MLNSCEVAFIDVVELARDCGVYVSSKDLQRYEELIQKREYIHPEELKCYGKEIREKDITCSELIQLVKKSIAEYKRSNEMKPNRVIMSRNYVDLFKKEMSYYDLFPMDKDVTICSIPIIIDECRTNVIECGFVTTII